MQFSPLTGEVFDEPQEVSIYPAKQYLTDTDRLKEAIGDYRNGIGRTESNSSRRLAS